MDKDIDDVAVDYEMSEDEKTILRELGVFGESRRKFLGKVGTGGASLLALQLLAEQEALAAETGEPLTSAFGPRFENALKVTLKVNGEKKSLEVDSRMTLLDALRERLALTGTKKGCDRGQCGSCTVIVEGERVLSCLALAATCEGKDVTTIEGLAEGDSLHPLQAAFIKYDAFQCGYCTPGQICSSVALLDEAKNGELSHVSDEIPEKAAPVDLSDDEIRERMSGNLCRCGAYPNILKAIQEVEGGREVAQTWSFYNSAKEGSDETV
ncbi:MAG: 2Fe-2S iron-sulfur cluster binding domain-containing protein [Pyrinomonadaceae bacterium]|nr:2Fe-2S iron-sulfur cluster binding domain-containing protein [Pyrinomonadaceae bacterium]